MNSDSQQKYYRIGDFAKYMGVTPDFLKHYEGNGLLEVQQSANGYRHYPFSQSAQILEYMRLRNYGVSVKEMRSYLSAGGEEAVALLDKKAEDMRLQAERMLAIVEEHRRIKSWFDERRRKPVDWEVRNVEAHCFLPHTNEQDFLMDERIYPLLKAWVDWMPIAKSSLRITPLKGQERRYSTSWGMILPAPIAQRYAIPLNGSIETMPATKAFVYHFVGMEALFSIDHIARGEHPMFDAMAQLGLKPAGTLYLVVEMKLTNPNGSRRGGSGRFIVPIAE